MIPEAAVEAARKVWSGLEGEAWQVAHSALEAAAPHIRAEAWDEGRNHGATFPYGRRGLATDDNTYRPTP